MLNVHFMFHACLILYKVVTYWKSTLYAFILIPNMYKYDVSRLVKYIKIRLISEFVKRKLTKYYAIL